jgi:hypothetical protein
VGVREKTKQNSVAKIIINTVWQFSIVINAWRWPSKAETCEREKEKKDNIYYVALRQKQWHCMLHKHVSTETNTHTAIEEPLDMLFQIKIGD